MESLKLPYEVLVRFGEDGEILGAHVQWAVKVMENGKRLSYTPLPAEPAGATLDGFPLSAAVTQTIAEGLERAAPNLADYERAVRECEAAVKAATEAREETASMRRDFQATADLLEAVRAENKELRASLKKEAPCAADLAASGALSVNLR